jgi:hypothetical protein
MFKQPKCFCPRHLPAEMFKHYCGSQQTFLAAAGLFKQA